MSAYQFGIALLRTLVSLGCSLLHLVFFNLAAQVLITSSCTGKFTRKLAIFL